MFLPILDVIKFHIDSMGSHPSGKFFPTKTLTHLVYPPPTLTSAPGEDTCTYAV